MEIINSIKIEVEIDTNKITHKETFDDMEKAKEYYDEIVNGIYNP